MELKPEAQSCYSHLEIGPLRKKHFTEWTVTPRLNSVSNELKAKVKLVTVQVFLSEEPLERSKSAVLVFTASIQGQKEDIKDTDLQRLREKVHAYVDKVFSIQGELTWEPYLCVEFESDDKHLRSESEEPSQEARLTLKYSRVTRGVAPDGKAYGVHQNGFLMPFPAPEVPSEPIGKHDFLFKSLAKTVSYIPATEQNIAALDAVQAQMRALARRLEGLMHQEVLESNLSNAGLHTMLSAPEVQ